MFNWYVFDQFSVEGCMTCSLSKALFLLCCRFYKDDPPCKVHVNEEKLAQQFRSMSLNSSKTAAYNKLQQSQSTGTPENSIQCSTTMDAMWQRFHELENKYVCENKICCIIKIRLAPCTSHHGPPPLTYKPWFSKLKSRNVISWVVKTFRIIWILLGQYFDLRDHVYAYTQKYSLLHKYITVEFSVRTNSSSFTWYVSGAHSPLPFTSPKIVWVCRLLTNGAFK